jgi:hypothetical protein
MEREHYPFPKSNKFRLDPLLVELVIRKKKKWIFCSCFVNRAIKTGILSLPQLVHHSMCRVPHRLTKKTPLSVTGLSFLLSARNAKLGAQLVPGPGTCSWRQLQLAAIRIRSYVSPCQLETPDRPQSTRFFFWQDAQSTRWRRHALTHTGARVTRPVSCLI